MAKERAKATASGASDGDEASSSKRRSARSGRDYPWNRGIRLVVSAAVLLHLSAMFIAPWANQSEPRTLPPDFAARRRPPGSDLASAAVLRPEQPPAETDFRPPPLIDVLIRFFRPYLNATYTNHGYDFFTPDPSGSYLIGYQVKDEAGQAIAEGQYPNLDDQWPRLFYHRHMMLAAQIDDFGRNWPQMIGQRLIELHGGASASIYFVYHRLPLPEEVAAGVELDASWLYETRHRFDIEAGKQAFEHVEINAPGRVKIPGVSP